MNRLKFLAALFGGSIALKAQDQAAGGTQARRIGLQWQNARLGALNNQCPVCGVVADSWKVPQSMAQADGSMPFQATACKYCRCMFLQQSVLGQ